MIEELVGQMEAAVVVHRDGHGQTGILRVGAVIWTSQEAKLWDSVFYQAGELP